MIAAFHTKKTLPVKTTRVQIYYHRVRDFMAGVLFCPASLLDLTVRLCSCRPESIATGFVILWGWGIILVGYLSRVVYGACSRSGCSYVWGLREWRNTLA